MEEVKKNTRVEVEGEMERVAVVCKHACCEPRSSLIGQVFERSFEEDVVAVSGDESDGVRGVFVLASVPSFPCLIFACGHGA